MRSRGRLFAASFLLCVTGSVFAQDPAAIDQQPQFQGPTLPVGYQPDTGPALENVHGSVMKLFGASLVVGLRDGGLATYDCATKDLTRYVKGEGYAPAKDVTMLGNRAYWVVAGQPVVYATGPGVSKPYQYDVREVLGGPVRRIGVWQEYIVAHGDTGCCFIEASSGHVMSPEQVLPADVASAARQGIVTTSWKDGAGLFVVIRKYGARTNPKPGEAKDLGMLTAWSAPWRGTYTLLGSYTCDLVKFDQTATDDVQLSGPSATQGMVSTTGLIGNVLVSNSGIVGLNNDQALTIPFYKDNWVTDRINTTMAPHYAQVASCSDSDLWWVSSKKLVRASLEDGSSEVFTPRSDNPMLGVAADDDGAWIMQDDCIKRVDDFYGKTSFVSYEVGPDTAKPAYGGQARLSWVLNAAMRPGGKKLPTDNSLTFVRQALKDAGVPDKKRANLLDPAGKNISELAYGDVIVNDNSASIYIGDGKQMTVQNGQLTTQPVTLDEDSSIHRYFLMGGHIPAGAHALPIVDIGPVFPIGVNRPDPNLGTDLFVRVDPQSPYDHPYLPSHYKLLEIAQEWIGTPYRWGGSSLSGTDCSGFVTSVYKGLGIKLPRFSQDIARTPFGEVVFDELHFGDVLVYPEPKHCAIYIGDGKTVETTKGAVGYSNVYRRHCAYVRRFLFE